MLSAKKFSFFFLIPALLACHLFAGQPADKPEAGFSENEIRQLIDQSARLLPTEPEKAVQTGKMAIEKADASNQQEILVDAMNSLGLLYYRLNRLDQAEEVLLEAASTGLESGYLHGRGVALNRLGNSYWILEKRLEAKALFEEALAIFTDLDDWREISRTLTHLANAYRYWDDYPKAIELFLEAREGYRKIDFQEGEAWLGFSLGILHKKLEDYDKALESINSALEIYSDLARKDGSYNGVMICYGQLGDIYNLTGDPEQGLDYQLKALEFRKETGNQAAIADGLSGVAESYFYLGDYPKSLDYFQQSQAIRRETGRKDGMAVNLKYMGEILRNTGKEEKALDYFNQGLKIARELNDRDTESEILEITASLLALKGRYREAWEIYQQHLEAQEHILSTEISKRVASMQLQHEIERQAAENEELQKENRIKDLQLEQSRVRFVLLIMASLFAALGGITAFYLHQKQRQIKTLQGLIPICTHCKKIRTDSGFYEQLETYISEHSDAQFSHGICPECYEEHYSDLLDDDTKSSD